MKEGRKEGRTEGLTIRRKAYMKDGRTWCFCTDWIILTYVKEGRKCYTKEERKEGLYEGRTFGPCHW
jgi:hypothetical protein